VLHVGGTIGMTRTDAGYAPVGGFLEAYLAGMPELRRDDVPAHEVRVLEPLLDSADLRPDDWLRIARAVAEEHDDFDGFVVVHGTDTMAYTASALSFLLPGLAKPVILTGAQISLAEARSDGREHLLTSVLLAGTLDVPEVCIYFAQRLLRGNRAQKVQSDRFAAFDSGNFPALAHVGVEVELRRGLVLPAGAGVPRRVDLRRRPEVASLRVYPGLGARMLERVLAPPLDGLVLETYGAGNAPVHGAEGEALVRALREASGRGVVIVNCSQCHGGRVRQDLYATGRALADAGVVSGRDMTPEAALTKLYVLLGSGAAPDDARARVGVEVAGEMEG
jgi:L-asparaginase